MARHRIAVVAGVAIALSILSCTKDPATSPPADPGLDSPYLLGSTNGSPSYIHTFSKLGTYRYRCRLHTGDVGIVFVADQGSDSAFISISLGDFHPDTVTVHVDGRVRWQNFDEGTHHTITSY